MMWLLNVCGAAARRIWQRLTAQGASPEVWEREAFTLMNSFTDVCSYYHMPPETRAKYSFEDWQPESDDAQFAEAMAHVRREMSEVR
jgi:hypothetical protein